MKDRFWEIFSVTIVIAIGTLVVFLYLEPNERFREINIAIVQALIVMLMLITVILAKRQIVAFRKSEEDKRNIAIQSLIEELKYNKAIIKDYIEHSVVGSNLGKDGNVSYEWTSPISIAYEQNLFVACREDTETSTKLMNLYNHLESCRTIVGFIHQLIASSLIESDTIVNIGSKKSEGNILWDRVTQYNANLKIICDGIKDGFDNLIKSLEAKKSK